MCRRCGIGSPIAPHASSRSSVLEESARPGWRWSSHAGSRNKAQRAWCSSPWPPFGSQCSSGRPLPRLSESLMSAHSDLPMRARLACGNDPTWIVLDNFEQVLDAGSLVANLLTTVAPLQVSGDKPRRASCARRTRVRGRTAHVGARLGGHCRPRISARSPAVRLFVERVRDVQPHFRLTAANGPTVAAICQRLDALPLALELAAPWIKVLNAEGLLRRLQQDVLLSTVGPRDLPERQRTMNATIAWSYELLDANEQRVFRRLGALPGRFSMDAAAAVLAGAERSSARSDEALGAVASLIDKSLLLRAESASAESRPLPDARNRACVCGARARRLR